MRKFCLRLFVICLPILLTSHVTNAQVDLLSWEAAGVAGSEASFTSNFNIAGLNSSVITRGVGLTAAGNANRINATSWTITADGADAVTGNDYFEFTVTPQAGNQFSVTQFVFSYERSATGPPNFIVRSSLDGFTTNIGSISGLLAAISSGNTINISGVNNQTGAVTFRMYGFAATGTAGSGGFESTAGADFIIKGSMISAGSSASVAAGTHAAEGEPNGTFNISLSNAAPTGGVSINYTLGSVASNEATLGMSADYTDPQGGSITLNAGDNSAVVTLNINDDAAFEGTEIITITLNSATNGYTIGTATASINLTDNDPQPVFDVVVNQVYGGGGNSGSVYKNDFIELFNNENIAVSLAGWSVQYQSAAGTGTWQVTNLSGTIPPHGFYLVQEVAGAGGTTNLPVSDATGTIAMAAGSGKVILCNTTTAQTGANPSGINVIDKVGYGTATGFETAPAGLLENATAAQRSPDGFDTDNNSTDFIIVEPPVPRNSTYTTAAPVVVTFSPPNNSLDVPYNVGPSLIFNKPVQKGTGTITFFENGVPTIVIDVTSPAVTISNNTTATINTILASGKSYFVHIDAGTFKDVFGNNFAGISNNSTWAFTTYNSAIAVTLPATFNFQNCSGSGLLPHGFTQYSIAGTIRWDCTPFGRDPAAPAGTAQFPNGIQMNGFANGTNVPNIDWLISPSIDLTGTVFPLLSFWSRTAFNGAPLQLKVSTDYVSGDPSSATWVDINGKFPAQTSNTWTLAEFINLSAFKQSNVHFAFVYTSSDEDGARWTIDDVQLDNSAVPPPPSLTIGTSDIQFPYVASGSTFDKTFTFIGNDLTNDITLDVTGAFLISKDGISFSSTLLYTVGEANNVNETVYVRFAPTQNGQDFTGTVTVTTGSLSGIVNLVGTSIDPNSTLEIVNWNMEWFGSTDPSLGPTNDPLQEQNAKTILQSIGADLYALVEVVDEARLQNIVNQMPGYSYVICNYGSHTNINENNPSPLSQAQKEAFVYKTSVFSNITTMPLLSQGTNSPADLSNPAYNYWSSGRFPFLMSADVTLNCVTKNVKFVLCHAKANTSPTATAYQRRKQGADTLHFTLNALFPGENIIILGDINDDLDSTITAGISPRITSWSSFTNDSVNYPALTLPLSRAGKKSTVGFNDVIDHVIASDEMAAYYMANSANILNDVADLVSNYGSTTSDHFPVFTRYRFELPPAPLIICHADIQQNNTPGTCGAMVGYYIIYNVSCGEGVLEQIEGIANGSEFPVGTTTNTFVVTDGAGSKDTCSFMVTIIDSEKPTIACPANIDADSDPGSCGATVNYTVAFADNCPGATMQQTTGFASGTVFPAGTTTNTFVVTDASGNTETCSFTVTVSDNEAPTFTRPADKTIAFTSTCTYDASPAATGDVTNEHDNCSFGIQATYTDLVSACGNIVTITRTWKLADNGGNQAPAQVQIIRVTDNNTTYLVYAVKEAKFGELNLINGSVGVTASNGIARFKTGTILPAPYFARAKSIDAAVLTVIPNKILSAANDGPNPPFFNFAGTTTGLPSLTLSSSTATPVSANYKQLKIKKNVTVTITGTLYGMIDIEEGAQVTFSPAGGIVNIENLKLTGRSNAITRIKFSNCTSVRIKDKVEVGEFTQVNMDGPKVTFCLGDTNNDDEQFIVEGNNNIIAVNVYIKKGQLKVNGDIALMKGWFIAESVLNEGRLVVWNDNNCSTTSAMHELVDGKQKLKEMEAEVEKDAFTVEVSPNPSTSLFTVRIQSRDNTPVTIRISDVSGKFIMMRQGVASNSAIQLGNELKNGIYFAEVTQGKVKKVVKLIKLQ
ncbi:MAG: HYR domain-containing protein [Chitinophagales bacterium]